MAETYLPDGPYRNVNWLKEPFESPRWSWMNCHLPTTLSSLQLRQWSKEK